MQYDSNTITIHYNAMQLNMKQNNPIQFQTKPNNTTINKTK